MSKVSTVSSNCVELVKQYEGFYSLPYLCPANVPTIGYGTTIYPNGEKVTLNDASCTNQQATEWLMFELNKKAKEVDAFTTDTVTQNEFDSLVSFAYNVGTTALKNSTLLKRVNTGKGDIRAAFMMWVYANGKPLKGLIKRRKSEADLYLSK